MASLGDLSLMQTLNFPMTILYAIIYASVHHTNNHEFRHLQQFKLLEPPSPQYTKRSVECMHENYKHLMYIPLGLTSVCLKKWLFLGFHVHWQWLSRAMFGRFLSATHRTPSSSVYSFISTKIYTHSFIIIPGKIGYICVQNFIIGH